MSLGIGLLGAGRIGKLHAQNVQANPHAQFAWVYDPITSVATALAEEFGTPVASSVEQVFEDGNVDGVIVATPASTHLELIAKGVDAGKAVLCEKPLTVSVGEADECWNTLKTTDSNIMLGFNRRFDSSFSEARARALAGEVGTIEQLLIISRDPEPPPQEYVDNGGWLYHDTMIHDFDMARYFLGEISEVTALGLNKFGHPATTIEQVFSAIVTLRSEGGALCSITNTRHCSYGYDQRLEVFGAKGALQVSNQVPTSVTYSGKDYTNASPPKLHFFQERYQKAYELELEHFIECMLLKQQPEPTFWDGRQALVLAESAWESHRTGQAISVPNKFAKAIGT